MHWTNFLAFAIVSEFFSTVQGAAQCDGGALEANVIEEFLKKLNGYRSELVRGLEKNEDGTLPKGKTMNRIYWSCDLEKDAIASHSDRLCYVNKELSGKSVISDIKVPSSENPGVDGCLLNLLGKISNSLHSNGNQVISEKHEFANLANAKTTEIGCAYYETCFDEDFDENTGYLFYCFTNQAALNDGETVYEVGNGGCEDCRVGVCNPDSKLCERADYPKGVNTKCSNHKGMTDELRSNYVDMHNYRRGLLANGEVARKNGNHYPKGANIIKLEVNCELEAGAFAYASTCPNAVSFEGQREDVAEHYHRVSAADAATYRDAFKSAVTNWWKVVRHHPGPGVKEVTFRAIHVGTPIETFTQMAWATTSHLGCSVVKCSSDYVIICRYSPKGNIIEQKLYTPGPPCSMCSKGCYRDQGLCFA